MLEATSEILNLEVNVIEKVYYDENYKFQEILMNEISVIYPIDILWMKLLK